MTAEISPFQWLDLEKLYRRPGEFPRTDIIEEFPLFPLLTAASLVTLLDPADVFNETVGELKTKAAKPPKKNTAAPLIEIPSQVLEILRDSEKLDEWLRAVRISLGASQSELERDFYIQPKNKSGEHQPKSPGFLHCSALFAKYHPSSDATGILLPAAQYGLRLRHLTALSALEHLDLVYRAIVRNDPDLARQHFEETIGMLLLHSDRSFYAQLGWLPPEAKFFHPLKTHFQQVQDHFPGTKGIPLRVQRLVSEVNSRRTPPKGKERPEWERLERIRLISRREDLLHFIGGVNKALFKYQNLYPQLSGSLESSKTSRVFRQHIMTLALPIMESSGNRPWSSFYQAANDIYPALREALMNQPLMPQADGAKGSGKKIRNRTTTKTLESILAEMASDYPEFFRIKL